MARNPKKNLEEIKFGEMNALRDSPGLTGLDPRRSSTSNSINSFLKKKYTPNQLEGKTIWNAIILRSDATTIPLVSDPWTSTMNSFDMVDVKKPAAATSFRYKIYIPELDSYRSPIKSLDLNDKEAQGIINTYCDAFPTAPRVKVAGGGDAALGNLAPGTPVVVMFSDKERTTRAKIVQVDLSRVIPLEGIDPLKYQFSPEAIAARAAGSVGYVNAHGGPPTGGKSNNLVYKLKRDHAGAPLPIGTSDQRVTGEDIGIKIGGIGSLEAVVETEFAFWKGRKETSGDMDKDGVNETDERIYKYNDFVMGSRHHIKSGGKYFHWSAVFVSWVVNQVTPFPRFSAHTFYARAAKKGESGWTLWMTETAGSGKTADPEGLHAKHKIQANIGDVHVQPPTGTRLNAGKGHESHADVVYKIEGGKAHLAGGNLSNTAKSPGWLPVDADGNYSGYAAGNRKTNPYQLVMKKNGKLVGGGNA